MGIFSRIATLIKSNLNDLISRSEDPEKMLNQIVVDMNEQLVEARRPQGSELDTVHTLVRQHAELTGSARASGLLDDWEAAGSAFWRIAPRGKLSRVERSERGVQAGG